VTAAARPTHRTDDPVQLTVQAHQALAVADHSDMVWGHACVRDPEGRGIWMKASGWAFEEITPERVVLVSPDGEVLAGGGNRHVEYPIHTEIVRARPDVGAVVHSHAKGAVAFASLDVPLLPVSHDAVSFLDPDVPRYTGTSDLISTRELGEALAEALGDSAGVLIPGHGFVTVGETVASAVMRAVWLNRACHTQLQAIAAGGPALWSTDADALAKRHSVQSPALMESGFEYLLRRVDAGRVPVTGI
jgi:ribulose-5-phosphate 4-epimerase/fuculose-1-phosphate aldolase